MEKMKDFNLTDTQAKTLFLLSLVVLMCVLNTTAYAGTDATFDSWVTQMTDWLQGSLGKGIAIGFILVGIVMGMIQQSLMAFAIGVGAALGLNYTPTILTNMFSAVL